MPGKQKMIETIIGEAGGILPLLCALAIGGGVLVYVLLDGTDLGTGTVFLLFHDMSDRKQIISSILPIWDANETWIVLVAGGLIAMFPAASVTLFSGLYLPVIAMLITLAGRGIALEFRDHGADENERHRWDMVFLISSALTAFLQGLLFGAVLHGVANDPMNWGNWCNSFAVLCGAAFVIGYGWLALGWLVWRMTGELQHRARGLAAIGGALMLLMHALVTWFAMDLNLRYQQNWHMAFGGRLAAVPIAVVMVLAIWFIYGLRTSDFQPLAAQLAFIVMIFVQIAIMMFPLIAPPSLTINRAASPPSSQGFVLAGYALLVPTLLLYNTFGFRIFAGKVKADSE
jgi:cytochrome d ubiquinol oxidase subunit II